MDFNNLLHFAFMDNIFELTQTLIAINNKFIYKLNYFVQRNNVPTSGIT